MEEGRLQDVETLFAQVEDPRVERTKLHRLRDIIILTMCEVLCGAEGWVEIEEYAKAKQAFFTQLLDLPNGGGPVTWYLWPGFCPDRSETV